MVGPPLLTPRRTGAPCNSNRLVVLICMGSEAVAGWL